MKDIIEIYNKEVDALVQFHKNEGGGKARSKSGLAFENFIGSVCDVNNLVSKHNDYKKSEIIDGEQIDNLQVDKHIYRDNVMVKAIESKCYLDACYLTRAIVNFTDLYNSPDVPKNVEYAIVAGQKCVAEKSLKFESAKFKRATGKDLKLFVLNLHKIRNPKKAIYMEMYRNDFNLDMSEVKDFVEWLQK